MKRLILLLALIGPLAATTVYVPAVGAVTCNVTGATSATPSVVTTAGCSGTLSMGQVVLIYSTRYLTAGYKQDGLRKIASVAGANITITDINDTNVAGPATFTCNAPDATDAFLQPRFTCARLVVLTAYTAKDHPRVHGLDGSAGALTASIVNTAVGGKAHAGNPPWDYITAVNADVINPAHGFYYGQYNETSVAGGGDSSLMGLYWKVTGDATTLTGAKYMLGSDAQGRGFTEIGIHTLACSEGDTTADFCGGRYNASDFPALWLQNVALGYDLIHGELSSGEKQKFADMVLNDNDRAHNGLGMSTGENDQCTKNLGTRHTGVTVSGGNITCTGCLNGAVVGGALRVEGTETFVRIASITNNDSGTAATCADRCTTTGISSAAMWYTRPWATGDCGYNWFKRHSAYMWGAFSNGDATLYPPNGGILGTGLGNNGYTQIEALALTCLALVDDDPRAVECLAWNMAFWYDQCMPWFKNQWTGITTTNHNYQLDRTMWHSLLLNITIRNGITSGPDYNTGIYQTRMAPYIYMSLLPFDKVGIWQFGEATSFDMIDKIHSRPWYTLPYLLAGTTEGQRLWYWVKNVIGHWTTPSMYLEYVAFPMIFQDPNQTETNFSGAPLQYLFHDTDADSAECATTYNFGADCDVTRRQSAMISLTGLPSNGNGTTDTTVFFAAMSNVEPDHTFHSQPAMLHIAKDATFNTGFPGHGWLLSGDSLGGAMDFMSRESVFQFAGSDVGTYKVAGQPMQSWGVLTRWAGTNPTGPTNNSYTLGCYDVENFFIAAVNLTSAVRCMVHMKKAGSQDYIFDYSYATSSSGTLKKMFFHYWCPQSTAVGCNVTYSGNGATPTLVSKPSATSMINTSFLALGGTNYVFRDNTNGSYTSGNGYSYRLTMGAATGGAPTTYDSSNTNAEWLAVHQPAANNTATMPTITQPTDTNFWVTQVADATSPKVVAIGKSASTYTSASFSSTHSGTAQYLISGLTAGTYTVTVGGTPVTGSPFTVPANGNTLDFENAAGAVVVEAAVEAGVPGMSFGGRIVRK